MTNCREHPERGTVEVCETCGRGLCTLCLRVRRQQVICEVCERGADRRGRGRALLLAAGGLAVVGTGLGFLLARPGTRSVSDVDWQVEPTPALKTQYAASEAEPCDRDRAYALLNRLALEGHHRETLARAQRFFTDCGEAPVLRRFTYAAHKGLNQPRLAIAEVTQVIEAMPGDHDGWWWRGVVYQETGELERAEADFRRALEIEPRLKSIPFNLAAVLVRQKRPCDAVAAIEQFVSHHPGTGEQIEVKSRLDVLEALCRGGQTEQDIPAWMDRLELAVDHKHGSAVAECLAQLEQLGQSLSVSHGDPLWAGFFHSAGGRAWLADQARSPLPQRVDTTTLREARARFTSELRPPETRWADSPPSPPADVFEQVRYPAQPGLLSAYITPDPKDGKKHPAVVWAHGGFGGISEEFWSAAPASNDQSAAAFRAAGLVLMVPSWRGENGNPGRFELFYGEVDDLLAAVDYAKSRPYVDPERVYVAGHSTGGTLALLAAASSDSFRAVFSFGGAPDISAVVSGKSEAYGLAVPYGARSVEASRLRSALFFAGAIRKPTFYFEGEDSGYVHEARTMQRLARQAGAPFSAFVVPGADHFDILAPLTRLLAKKIKGDRGASSNIRLTEAEVAGAHRAMHRRDPGR